MASTTRRRFNVLKTVVVIAIALCITQTASAAGLTKIAENVYAYVDAKNASAKNSFGANAGIIIGRDGIAVIDTLISAKEADRFIKDIRAVSDKPIKYVVNTHHHLDHTFGNSEFAKLGAVIIDQENIQKIFAQYYDQAAIKKSITRLGLSDEDMKGTGQWAPALTFSERMTIDLGNQKVELIWVGHTHTENSIIAFLPDKKILFAGDLLFTNYHANLMDGDIKGWIRGLDSVMAMNAATIIPGHGPVSTNNDLQAMKEYLTMFDRTAREMAAQGKDAQTIASEIIKAFPERKQLAGMVSFNVQARYLKK